MFSIVLLFSGTGLAPAASPTTATLSITKAVPRGTTFTVAMDLSRPVFSLTSASLAVVNGRASNIRPIRVMTPIAYGGSNGLSSYKRWIQPDGTVMSSSISMPNAIKVITNGDLDLVLKADGTVATLGGWYNGNSLPPGLNNVVDIMGGPFFAALRADGTVVRWYQSWHAYDTGDDVGKLVALGSGSGMCGLRADGTVVDLSLAWPGEKPELGPVVAVAGSSALRPDGTVMTWLNKAPGAFDSLDGLGRVTAIDGGSGFGGRVITADGQWKGWGQDLTTTSTSPNYQYTTDYSPGNRVTAICGSLAVRADGKLLDSSGSLGTSNILVRQPSCTRYQFDVTPLGPEPVTVQFLDATLRAIDGTSVTALNTVTGNLVDPRALRIDLAPNGALAWGAKWRPAGRWAWRANGDTATGLTSGSQGVEFRDISLTGWQRPVVAPVAIVSGTTATLQTHYDNPPVTVTLASIAGNPALAPLRLTAQFSIPVTGFTSAGLALVNGRVAAVRPTTIQHAFCKCGIYSPYSMRFLIRPDGTIATSSSSSLSLKNFTLPPADLNGVIAITATNGTWLALRADGTVTAGGANFYGEANVPAGLRDVIDIAGGSDFSLALRRDGTLAAWSGIGPNNGRSRWVFPDGLNDVVAISAGDSHALALRANGTVVSTLNDAPTTLTDAVAISAGYGHSLALRADGTVVAWGDGSFGMNNIPPGLNNVVAIADGASGCLALRADGSVVAWSNAYNGLTLPPELQSGVVAIASSNQVPMAQLADGRVITWTINNGVIQVAPFGSEPARLPIFSRCAFEVMPTVSGLVSAQAQAGAGASVAGIATAASNMIQQQVLFPGALKITLLPAGAVSAGAQWRRVGTTAWLASGALEGSLLPGQYAIEFKDAVGWKRPANAQVTVTTGQTAQATRTYQDPRSGIAASGWTIY